MAGDVSFDASSGIGVDVSSFFQDAQIPGQSGTQGQGFQTNSVGGESFDYFGSLSEQAPMDYLPQEAYEGPSSMQAFSAEDAAPTTASGYTHPSQMAAQPTQRQDERMQQMTQPQMPQRYQQQVQQMTQQQAAQQQAAQQQAAQQQAMGQPRQQPTPDAGQDAPGDFFETLDTMSKRERTMPAMQAVEEGNRVAAPGFDYARRSEYGWAGVEEDEHKRESMRANLEAGHSQVSIGDSATRAERRTRKRYIASMRQNGEQYEKPFWMDPLSRVQKIARKMVRRDPQVAKKAKRTAGRAFRREGVGNRIWGKIIGDSSLSFREVGIGVQEILAMQNQDATMLDSLLAPYLGVDGNQATTEVMTTRELIDIINNNDVYVATFKPPNNQGADIQRRKLRVMERHQRGIFLHNIMAAMYTADYDGDDMEISFDPSVANEAKDPMDHIYDIFGKTTLNMDFIKVVNIEDVTDESGNIVQSRWDYVRDTMLADFMLDEYGEPVDRRTIAPLVQSILDLADSAFEDDDARAKAFGDMLRAARKYADKMSHAFVRSAQKGASDEEVSLIVRAVFDNMREIAYQNSLTTIGADVLTLETEDIPEPVTYGDSILYTIIDGMVEGTIPNNFQEVKLLLTGFAGNVEGKNAPFRFTADVGKMAKMDSRLMVGDEYVVDPNNDRQLKLFFMSTAKYAASLKMMRDIKKEGRSDYYMQLLRQKVIEEVGFPDDARYGNDFSKFLRKFAKSYNRHAMTINEANKVFLTNMQISTTESHGLVSAISATGMRKNKNGDKIKTLSLSDLAEPMLTIYGKFSVRRVFSLLESEGKMSRSNLDERWEGRSDKRDTHLLEREYDSISSPISFWITGKYLDYSLKKFRNENRLVGIKSDLDTALKRSIHDSANVGSVRLMFDMMLAIADKRTGAASTFNLSTYGTMEGKHGWNEKSTTKMMSQVLTSVAADLRQGGSIIAPGYYAGIGSQEIPDELAGYMTNLAKELAQNYGYSLRSGDAKGSDQAFARGAGRRATAFIVDSEDGQKHRLSRSGANGTGISFNDLSEDEQRPALDAIQRLHPNPGSFEKNAYNRNLMARNYYQVVGRNGEADSAFVACYATDEDDGTWQAIRLAHERGIPVFNLADYSDPEDWIKDVEDAAERSWLGQLRTDSVGSDQALRIDDSLRTLIAANRDMFMHYNMDSPATFLDSAYGQKLLQYAGDPEMIGGIYTSMVFDWRMERITSLTEEVQVSQTTDRFRQVWDDLNFAKDELSAASETWHGIIREFEMEATDGEKSFFQQMREQGYGDWEVNGRILKWDTHGITFDAAEFWHKGGLEKYRTLRQVIDDLDLDRTTKWNVIADVVRYWEKDGYLKSYEVGYQMEIGNDSTYYLGMAPQKAMTQAHREFEQAFNKWGRSGSTALREEVERARSTWGSTKGKLLQTLASLDSQPWSLVSIDDGMYADAVLAVYDKTYAQTEKANQNSWTNAIYSALSLQMNGGYMNDVTRTNDRMLGITAAESLTVQDIVHLLANPTEMMTVSLNGRLGTISRDILLDNELRSDERTGDIEEDLWTFLSRHPRIASAIRKHSACVMENSDGKGYVGAAASMTETMGSSGKSDDPIEKAKYVLRDHPAYAAIISLAVPGKGLVTRKARERIRDTENFFVNILCQAASDQDWDSPSWADTILETMGITRKSLRLALKSDYVTYLEKLGLDAYKDLSKNKKGEWVTESESEADDIYDYAVKRVSYYIGELHKAGVRKPSERAWAPTKQNETESFIGPDAVSAAAFWDVIQELSGAKTSVSTGIEGSETYRHAEWISHIRPKDRFVDIMSIDDEYVFDESWDGAWTSLTNQDGTPVTLTIDDSQGTSFFMTRLNEENKLETKQYFLRTTGSDLSFKDAIDDHNASTNDEKLDEISVLAPEGYQVQDKSIDTHGLQVPSLFAYMVSKRVNGAETFNLKAKKAGIDGLDSITKMRGKHKTNADTGRPVNFQEVLGFLRQIHAERGLPAAQLKLAQMMLNENKELGYKDLTLSNYLSIADLMLFEGLDGDETRLYLRSVEMLSAAIKERIGWRGDDMSEDELFDAVQAIVDDTSETAVGRQTISPTDALELFKPTSRASGHNAIRQQSSVFVRNYDLLQEIQRNAQDMGIEPLGQRLAEERDSKSTELMGFLDHKGRLTESGRNVKNFLSGYNITTVVTIGSDTKRMMDTPRQWSVGPSSVLAIQVDQNASNDEKTRDEAFKAYQRAYDLGMSVLMHYNDAQLLLDHVIVDSVPIDGEIPGEFAFIPCFDIRLNGSEGTPSRGQWSISQTPFSRYVVSVEDSVNEFGLGDAEARAFKNLTDRMSMRDGGSRQVNAVDLFPNVFKNPAFKDCQFSIGFANDKTISAHIVDGVNCTIDYGVAEGAKNFARRVRDVSKAVKRYQERWGRDTNPDGMLMDVELEPGDIIGWYECEIIHPDNTSEYVLAPIIPFELHGVKRQPSRFKVRNVTMAHGDGTLLAIDWENTTDLTDGYVKYFDSSGGANKGMISLSAAEQDTRVLLDGTPIDVYIAKESTDSRKVGTDRRIKTMTSMMALARMHGYNFARKSDGSINIAAFPDNPTIDVNGEQVGIREALYADRISIDDWKTLMDEHVTFVADRELDAFIRFECNKVLQNEGNPSDYLANLYTDADGNEHNTHVMWEFEAMFEQGLSYEDGLLKFLHFVNPITETSEASGPESITSFCPNGIDDATSENTLFRLRQDNGEISKGYDRGVLQMRVPHKLSNGRTAYAWDNVSIGMSFFGEEYSGFSRPNVEGSSNFLDGMNTMSMYGIRLRDDEARHRYEWASSDFARPRSNGSLEAVLDEEA